MFRSGLQYFPGLAHALRLVVLQIVSSIDSSPEILSQVQEVIIPIIVFTLENKILGLSMLCALPGPRAHDSYLDLFDNMYDLVDSLTFKMHSISPNMWAVFDLTYRLFKSDAADFLDGLFLALISMH